MAAEIYGNIPVTTSASHKTLFQLPLPKTGPPEPLRLREDIWDEHHVKLPYSCKALLPKRNNVLMWEIIQKAYKNPIKDIESLSQAIMSYNMPAFSLTGLQNYLEKDLNEEGRNNFFESLLPNIIKLALTISEMVPVAIPLLKKHSNYSITLSQKQIGCLLANAFLCTFPDQLINGTKCGQGNMPDINFRRLFGREDKHTGEKFKCLSSYFERITSKEPDGVVTFSRQHLLESNLPDFTSSNNPLPDLLLNKEGFIEDANEHLQMDFADRYVGGMIYTKGCVQEEIRFLYCPELIVSRLFTEVLDEKEALIITGVERYNNGKGYSRSFKWLGPYNDQTERDAFKRRKTQVVAIDALSFFRRPQLQYKSSLMKREIYKAFAGFKPLGDNAADSLIPVATGNWGCGVFCGNPRLKALLQLIAAGLAGRNVTYFTVGNEDLYRDLGSLFKFLKENEITVGQLSQTLMSYDDDNNEGRKGNNLYDYIRSRLQRKS